MTSIDANAMTVKKKSTAARNARLADFIVKMLDAVLSPFGQMRKNTMMSVLAERMVPHIDVPVPGGKTLKFWGFGGWPCYRGMSALGKEPMTIAWLDRMEPGSNFWDIGANIGVFSLYAASIRNIRTYAFEPSMANLSVLAKNIELNGADSMITALPIALSDRTGLSVLNLQSTSPGNTGAQFSADTVGVPTVFKQACLGWTMDDFIESYNLPVPNYIKIDVDGLELNILNAAPKTLGDSRLKSLILEFTAGSDELRQARGLLESHGFAMQETEDTVSGKSTVQNYIFSRTQ